MLRQVQSELQPWLFDLAQTTRLVARHAYPIGLTHAAPFTVRDNTRRSPVSPSNTCRTRRSISPGIISGRTGPRAQLTRPSFTTKREIGFRSAHRIAVAVNEVPNLDANIEIPAAVRRVDASSLAKASVGIGISAAIRSHRPPAIPRRASHHGGSIPRVVRGAGVATTRIDASIYVWEVFSGDGIG